jgi:hypothetical protein
MRWPGRVCPYAFVIFSYEPGRVAPLPSLPPILVVRSVQKTSFGILILGLFLLPYHAPGDFGMVHRP